MQVFQISWVCWKFWIPNLHLLGQVWVAVRSSPSIINMKWIFIMLIARELWYPFKHFITTYNKTLQQNFYHSQLLRVEEWQTVGLKVKSNCQLLLPVIPVLEEPAHVCEETVPAHELQSHCRTTELPKHLPKALYTVITVDVLFGFMLDKLAHTCCRLRLGPKVPSPAGATDLNPCYLKSSSHFLLVVSELWEQRAFSHVGLLLGLWQQPSPLSASIHFVCLDLI